MKIIKETIPDFHNIISRLSVFKTVLDQNVAGRALECKDEIKFVYALADQMSIIEHLRKRGIIKERVTHNDTKFNNVLLSADYQKSCVIDLDTVMPGVVHYDFGDGVRTSASTAVEDEWDLNLVQLDMDKFEGYASGYLDNTREILDPVEIEYLALSAPMLAYIMGVRFLTDFLSGDPYYKVEHEKHNLQRAKCQLHFAHKMLERLPDLKRTITNLAANH